MKTLMVVLMLASVVPAAAVSMGDTLGLEKSLTIEVIHGGPACSSGSELVGGTCQPAGMPVVIAPPLTETLALSEHLSIVVSHAVEGGPPLEHAPEPATALLLGTGLALAAGAPAVRRWTWATSPGR